MNSKRILYTISLVTCLLCLFTSCENDEKDQLEIPYLFRPIGLQVSLKNTTATITWGVVDSATSYVIKIYKDSMQFSDENLIIYDSVLTNGYVTELESNTRYSIGIKAKAFESSRDSKFNQTLTFITPDIFNDYYSFMYDEGIASINWMPGIVATKLVVNSPTGEKTELVLNDDEIALGHKMCYDLSKGTYTFELYNGNNQKGSVKVTIEGDYFIQPGDNIGTVLNGITQDSAVIIVKPGIYGFEGAYLISRNIRIKGLYVDTIPVICMVGASATANMFDIVTTSEINFIKFENIEFSGYVGGGTTGTKIGYLFNQASACDVNDLSFINCIIRNIGNTPVRLKEETAIKIIENVIFDNCLIYDIGYSSVYAVVNANILGSYINNITFKNSTVYNFAGSLILHNTVSSNSVLIENCTFDQITTSATGTTIRYFIDFRDGNNVANGITINNCIFGSTPRAYTEGVRASASTTVSVSKSYRTTDYYDNNAVSGYSIMGSLTEYTKTSSELFTNPLTGDFTIKDASFAGKKIAGDPRWRP